MFKNKKSLRDKNPAGFSLTGNRCVLVCFCLRHHSFSFRRIKHAFPLRHHNGSKRVTSQVDNCTCHVHDASTPAIKASPSAGTPIVPSVASKTTKEVPGTAAIPLDVTIRTSTSVIWCQSVKSMPYTCAKNSAAID